MIALDLQHRHAARVGRHRPDPQDAPSLQELAEDRACAISRATWWTRGSPPSRWTATRSSLYQKMFNVTQEERDEIIRVLAEDESEAVGSMGDDTPMPVLSHKVRSLYDYFRQQFAQVTNPPIDPLREIDRDVAADADRPGVQHLRARPRARPPDRARLADPLAAQAAPDPRPSRRSRTNSSICSTSRRRGCRARSCACARRRKARCARASSCCCSRTATSCKGRCPAHALLVTGAVHQHLVKSGLRCKCNLLVETGTARDPHHFACLIGYGATAVYPYMAYQVLFEMMRGGHVKLDFAARLELGRSYRAGVRKGLFKIMSKMGISTIASYRSSQLFEIVGLADEVVQLCFTGTESRVQGADFADLEADLQTARRARLESARADRAGRPAQVRARRRVPHVQPRRDRGAAGGGDLRRLRPLPAVRATGERAARGHVPRPARRSRPPRSRCRWRRSSRWRRSWRASTAPACRSARSRPRRTRRSPIAMNRLGARSNSGEGGEDPARYRTEKNSKIKQVASGPLRRDAGVPDQRRGAADQDRAGRQARRGRSAARAQGQRHDRAAALRARRASGSSRRRRITTSTRSRIWRSSSSI